jgi:Cu(I)/Ag(I) efflux system membrane fusion protein
MRRLLLGCAAIIAAAAGAAWANDATRSPLYYQDPDGKPFYAAAPRKTADGRDYKPVLQDAPDATASSAPPPAPKGDHRVLYYRNPMGLADTSPKPKKDSMGMDYLPVYADESSQNDPPGTVRVSPGRLQTLGVRTETAVMRPASARTVSATGTLQFDERHLATVTTKVSGWIEHLAVAATGDPVRQGQVLAEIYSPELVASEEEYLVAARMGGAMSAAAMQRLHALDIPDDEIERLRRTGRSSRRIAVMAPADGVVIEKPIQQGMRVEAGEALYRTADLSSVWLIAQVQERDLGAIATGARAAASFVAFPGRSFDGTVDFVYPSLSPETRTARVRIVMPNPDGVLLAAMYANVQIGTAAGTQPILSVPDSAVLDSGSRQIVLLARDAGRFEPRPVRLGIRGDDWVQVVDGLKPGDQVVVGANFLIDAESNLRAALQGFADGAAAKPSEPGDTP